ncbi:MAG: ribose-5-phosphate isomerase [Propionibacteriaceae bacterium]|jgi:ribose 5-phosphate isomerase B|nr:ribose-5-phosphate isomerase [Propionibacteriaceae bacterium]
MRIHIGTDHAAFETKNAIAAALRERGHEVIDHGALAYDAEDDYPVYIIPTAEAVVSDAGSLGIVLGGSGNGEVIAANKVEGVRAAVIHSEETARLAREHNDANVASIGGRMDTVENNTAYAITFVETAFSGEERHMRRLRLVTDYEETGHIK